MYIEAGQVSKNEAKDKSSDESSAQNEGNFVGYGCSREEKNI